MSQTRCIKLTVAYDGTDFAGWQVQPDRRTVQAEVERAWRSLTGEDVRVTASGRTDSGVHAEGQVVGIETESTLPVKRIHAAMNAKLPEDIVVRTTEEAPARFHATHDALRKTYRYQIHNSRVPPLFDRRFVWHIPTGDLDSKAMEQGGATLEGRHDFACFESAGSERTTTVRTIIKVKVTHAAERIDIEVTGDGFLYNMVRAIAGTLVEVGRGSRDPTWVSEVLAARDRKLAGPTAPACGLILASVEY